MVPEPLHASLGPHSGSTDVDLGGDGCICSCMSAVHLFTLEAVPGLFLGWSWAGPGLLFRGQATFRDAASSSENHGYTPL